MHDAIGSSWIVYLVVIFMIVYVFFMAFVMNYAAAYRAVNYVITQIENCQGQMDNCNNVTMESITKTVKTKYRYITPNMAPNTNGIITPICIKNGAGVIYRVELPVEFDLPLLGGLRWITVKAETKTIQRASCG